MTRPHLGTHRQLRTTHGLNVGRKRVGLMRQAGISALVPKKRGETTIRVPGVRVCDDLVERNFKPAEPHLRPVLGVLRVVRSLLTIVGLLTVLAGTAAAAPRSEGPCRPAGSRALAADDAVRVYRIASRNRYDSYPRVYACSLNSGRRVLLAVLEDEDGGDTTTVDHVRLVGRFVAYVWQSSGRSGAYASVRLLDMRTRRVRRVWSYGQSIFRGAVVHDLEIGTRLSLAWTVWRFDDRERSPNREVMAGGPGRDATVLDSGLAERDLVSLAVSGSAVYWTNQGEPRATQFP